MLEWVLGGFGIFLRTKRVTHIVYRALSLGLAQSARGLGEKTDIAKIYKLCRGPPKKKGVKWCIKIVHPREGHEPS